MADDELPEEYTIPDEWFADAVTHDPTARVKRGKARDSSAWITGPGSVLLLVEAARDLLEIAAARGETTTEVTHVRVAVLRKIRTLVLWPSNSKDPMGVEVTWRRGTASIVASFALIDAKIPVESGKRKRFPVYQVPKSKFGPIVAIHMRNELDVKVLPKRDRRKKQG